MEDPTVGFESRRRGKSQRRLKNYLLQPSLQLQIGVYVILVATAIGLGLVAVLYATYARLVDLLLELSEVREEVAALLWDYTANAGVWVGLILLVFVVVNITLSIVMTHRFVGPTIAFRRHIERLRQGDYASRIILRNSDAFGEVAQDLNQLAEDLQTRFGNK